MMWSRSVQERRINQHYGVSSAVDVDVKFVPAEAFEAEWAIAYSADRSVAYLILREDAVCARVLRESWVAWEAQRALLAAA